MKLSTRLFLFAAAPLLLIFSACNKQNASQSNQNQSSQNQNIQNVSSPAQTATKESGFVYTADERGNSISVIDLDSNQVQKIPISVSPHNIQVSQDGRLLLVVGAPATGGGHSHEEKAKNRAASNTATADTATRAANCLFSTPRN